MLFAQLTITAHAPDSVAACEAVELSVVVRADGAMTPQLVPPPLTPFEVLRSSTVPPPQSIAVGGGSQGTQVEYRYVLATEQAGTFTLGSFEARAAGLVARSRPVRIVVSPSHANSTVPTIVARARVDTGLDVNFRALALPETVFVGQQANYEVAVFLNESVRDRLRRNPTFYPPDMQSTLAYDVPPRAGDPPRRRVGTRCFDALVYERALFPLVPGRISIPPAQLTYSLALSSSFFSREETRDLQTDSTVLFVVEPPVATRPSDYSGAVGDLRVTEQLDTTAARVGDPMLLTVKVIGSGNVKLFPRPAMAVSWATLVPAEERVQIDTTVRRVQGAKEFDWVLTPKLAGELELPPIRYTYFNPDTRKYETAAAPSARVHIALGSLATADTTDRRPVPALRPAYGGPVATAPEQRPLFWLFLAVAPLPALTIQWRERRKRAVPHTRGAAALRTLARRRTRTEDPCALRRAFTLALAERLGISVHAFTRSGEMARVLRRSGVASDTAADAERLFHTLDVAAFAPDGALPRDAASRAVAIYEAVNDEALRRIDLVRRAGPVVVLLCLSVAAAAGALQQDDARAEFVHGVSEYYNGRYVSARDAFARAARDEPRAVDAWANLGTAAWVLGDTARAVAGWQRALRLDPLSDDVRERLDAVHASAISSNAYVPPVPVWAVVWLAAALWQIAWASAAVAIAQRRPGRVRGAMALALGSMLLAFGALVLRDHEDEARLAVVRLDTSLSTVPAIGGQRVGSATVGEVARITGRQGVWLRLSLDDGREGWLDTTQVIPLEDDASSD